MRGRWKTRTSPARQALTSKANDQAPPEPVGRKDVGQVSVEGVSRPVSLPVSGPGEASYRRSWSDARRLHDRPTLAPRLTRSSSSCANVSTIASAAPVPAASRASFEEWSSCMTNSVLPSFSSNVTVVTGPPSPPSSLVHTRRECGVTSRYVPKNAIASGSKLETVLAPDTNIHLTGTQGHAHRLRHPPPREQLGLGPRLEHDAGRGVEGSGND